MATLKQRLHRKNGSSYDVVHLETESNVVMRPSGNTVETDLTNYLPKVQDSDDVPEGLTTGQIVIGASKGYYCTGDGEVREFGKGGGGVPVYGKDFTYTGEYLLIDDNDGNWRIKFLTSGTFIPLTDMTIDVFLVGGGGGRGNHNTTSAEWTASKPGCGGGGYTTTSKLIVLTPNTEYPIVIGEGGVTSENNTKQTDGGNSTAFNQEALGGKYAKYLKDGGYHRFYGGNGGSGGAPDSKSGGIDGANAETQTSTNRQYSYYDGIGQGTTTREFGESDGTLYASGGGTNITKVETNSGNGSSKSYVAANGIVVIRNHKPTSNLIPLSGNLTVGNTVTFDDKEWVVVHNDGNLWYLALSKIPENCRIISPGSNSNEKYVGSTIEAKVTEWETANLSALALQFCEDVTVENATHKVFLPTYTQVKTTFSHYAAAEANRICTVYVNNTDTAWDWWLSTPAGTYYWYEVTKVGKLNQYSNTGSAAIRPHICIRYDA